MSFTYPPSPPCDHVDHYHGIDVPDPYRWLEDPNSEQTREWIAAQNELTFGYLETLPARDHIQQRLTELWNYERYGVPWRVCDRTFYFKNDGLQNQSVLYTLPDLDTDPTVLLDPNTLSTTGTIALSGTAISEDARYLAYGLSSGGSDWQDWYVREIATGTDLNDHLRWVKFSGVAWTHDHQGFFYSRYDEPQADTQFEAVNTCQKLYYHRLGTDQSEDVLICDRPDHPDWGFNGTITQDGRYLIITVWRGTDPHNLLYYKDLQSPDAPIVELINTFHAKYHLIDSQDTTLWLETDNGAPRGRVIAIDLNTPEPHHWQELIPEHTDTLETVSVLNHEFVACYLHNAHAMVRRYTLAGHPLPDIALPDIGSVGGFTGKRTDTTTFYAFTSFTYPTTIYQYDLVTGQTQLFRQPQVDFQPTDYETHQIFYTSKDGTQVPMFLIHKTGIEQHGQHPTLLYGYGGFNISLTPSFSVQTLLWLELGGIYAVPNLRGGGEYGEAWHQAGMKQQKQTVFDDFIAAAAWLCDAGYTQPQKLAIKGGSNGGLLVGACMIQHPEQFAAALPAVGVMDMLRFPQFTIGWAWEPEYGSPTQAEDFQALYRYSPLHNLRPGTAYPATLIITADHDDRVVPAHSFKFAAALQAAHRGTAPVLIRIETQAGHGAGKPITKTIAEATDQWAFLIKALAMQPPED